MRYPWGSGWDALNVKHYMCYDYNKAHCLPVTLLGDNPNEVMVVGTENGGRRKMVTTIKPIRPTVAEFESEKEMERFMSEATDKKKTNDETMNRVREMMKAHKLQRKK